MATYDCPKCNGIGAISAFAHIENGTCFFCGGEGKVSFLPARKQKENPEHIPHIIPEKDRATEKQWDYLDTLTGGNSDMACKVLEKKAGAYMANGKFVSKALMSKAIEIAKADPECQKWARQNAPYIRSQRAIGAR
jgi:hypothetical protein